MLLRAGVRSCGEAVGMCAGLTGLSAGGWLLARGATRVVLAVSVSAPSAARMLEPDVDDLVSRDAPPGFYAVGALYARFEQLTDVEVKALLARARR